MADPWTEDEVAACVRAYVRMLQMERAGRPYVKAEVNAELRRGPLSARTKASVEYRMQNISAVLESLGLRRISGYVPARNVGPTVRDQILRLLGAEGFLNPGDYEPSADEQTLEERSHRIRQRKFDSPPSGNKTPRKTEVSTDAYVRDPAIIAWVREFAAGRCELCGREAPFRDARGEPYLEVHHVVALGDGGPDVIENAVALCPNCHRRCHYSADPEAVAEELYERVPRLVRPKTLS
ncbi:MAG: HNH endonuclease [Acidobacteria bacterium]|nr:MAG: HNH endonuclease [Acidobacteriota bacterium]